MNQSSSVSRIDPRGARWLAFLVCLSAATWFWIIAVLCGLV